MLASITPLGERSRNSRWGITVTAFVVASTASGAVVGSVFGSIGVPLRAATQGSVRLWILAAVVGLCVLFETQMVGMRLPAFRRQVNEQWLNMYRGWVYGAGFGAQLGAGVFTIVSTSAVYAALCSALLAGSPGWGALVGVSFGLVRGLSVLPARRVRAPAALVSLDARLRRWEGPARRLTVATLTAAGFVALAGAVR